MSKRQIFFLLAPGYALVLSGLIMIGAVSNHIVTTMSEISLKDSRHTVVIDPGHGGVDGGATSCSGILESNINLDISLRLNDLMHLLGINTIMIRDTDKSVYTNGETIGQKKISDLQERVRIINETDNAVVISIHQNTFSNEKYWGSQVFYAKTAGSQDLAQEIQEQIKLCIAPDNKRQIKKSSGVYLMEHIRCCGILLECGFLSNPKEEAMLRDQEYQKKLCSVIGCVFSQYLS